MAIKDKLDDGFTNKLLKKALIGGVKSKQAAANDDVLISQDSVVKISNSLTALQNSFNKIYAYSSNLKTLNQFESKRLQSIKRENTLESKIPAGIASAITASAAAGPDISQTVDKLDALSESIDNLSNKLAQSNAGGGIAGASATALPMLLNFSKYGRKLIGPLGSILDAYSRYSEGQSAGQIAAGVGGGLAGSIAGAEAGAALGALGGPAAVVTVPLGAALGGIGGYFAGSSLGDKAYESFERRAAGGPVRAGGTYVVGERGPEVITLNGSAGRVFSSNTKVSSRAEKEISDAAKKSLTAQAKLEKGKPISDTAYSSKLSNYLRDTLQNITSWVSRTGSFLSKLFGKPAGADVGDFSLSGDTRQDFQTIIDIAAGLGDPHPELTAAQWALESGYGSSRMARMLNNPFGQTTNNPSEGEVVTGSDGVTRIFKRYPSTEEAIKHHVERWNKKYTTADQTPEAALTAIINNRYVGNPEGLEARRYYGSIARILASNNVPYREPFKYQGPASGFVQRSGGVGQLTSKFGMRNGSMHEGIDIGAPSGTPVASLAPGTVKFAGQASGYGNVIYIEQDNGYQVRYGHLRRFAPGIRDGVKVKATQIIGEVGSTGRSTGPHLHLEVRRGDVPIDPLNTYNSNKWVVGGAKDMSAAGSTPISPVALVPSALILAGYKQGTVFGKQGVFTPSGQFIPSTARNAGEVPSFRVMSRSAQSEIQQYFAFRK